MSQTKVATRYESPDNDKPYVVIEHVSRNSYRITISHHKFWEFGPWYRRTQARAIKKGERELARYNRKYGELDKVVKIQ